MRLISLTICLTTLGLAILVICGLVEWSFRWSIFAKIDPCKCTLSSQSISAKRKLNLPRHNKNIYGCVYTSNKIEAIVYIFSTKSIRKQLDFGDFKSHFIFHLHSSLRNRLYSFFFNLFFLLINRIKVMISRIQVYYLYCIWFWISH